MTANDDLQSLKTRFYLSLEVKLITWAVLTLALGAAFTLPNLGLAFASLGGMLYILWVGMRDPFYRSLRQTETAPA